MGWFKNLFKSSDQIKAEIEEHLRLKLEEERLHEERIRRQVEEQILKEKMESTTPWYERILGSENAIHVSDKYRWNQAFIKDLVKRGFSGNSDEDIFKAFLDRQEEEERNRVVEEEREKLRNSDEPWVEVVGDEFDADGRIAIRLDWNKAFIKYLKSHGLRGQTDEILVQTWLAALQRESSEGDYT